MTATTPTAPELDSRRHASTRLLLLLTVLAGALLSVQARVNGSLARELGSAVVTALVSFSAGTAVLLVLVLGAGRLQRAHRARAGIAARWWWFCGGLGGAFLVSTSALAVPRIGVALLGVGVVAGQTVGSLAVDEVGLSPRGRQPITGFRAAGAALAVAALAIGALGDRRELTIGLFALIAAAGAGVSVQHAANGHLQKLTGEPLIAALISFTVGTLGLALLTVILSASGQIGALAWPGEPGLYLGGLCGATYITFSAAAVGRLGVLRLSLASVAGQLLGAVLLDAFRPAVGDGLAAGTVAATVLALVAVLVSGRGASATR